jgi:flagellar motor switch protein FliN
MKRMSDGAISQDEIDALLSGVALDGLNSSGHVGGSPSYKIDLPCLKQLADDLKAKLEENINKYTGSTFSVGTPVVEKTSRDKMLAKLPEVIIAINADYNEGIKGSHLYLISSDFALKLFALVNSEESTEVDDMVLSVVSEIVATHISAQILNIEQSGKVKGLAYDTPQSANESKAMVMFPADDFVLTSYPITLESNAYTLWEIIGGDVAEKIGQALGSTATEIPEPAQTSSDNSMNSMMNNSIPNNINMQQNMGNMMNMQQNMGMMPNMGMNMGGGVPNVQQLQYPNLQPSVGASEQGNIGLIMDVFMEMTVELGRTKKSIKDILGMGEGTIIELDKLAGEPVDILVNHKLIAKGEVVVIDENFGVRVTEILSPMERVNELN